MLFRHDQSAAVSLSPSRLALRLMTDSRLRHRMDSPQQKRVDVLKLRRVTTPFELQWAKPLRREWQLVPLFRLHPLPPWYRWKLRRGSLVPG
jgi:hypothetical protein